MFTVKGVIVPAHFRIHTQYDLTDVIWRLPLVYFLCQLNWNRLYLPLFLHWGGLCWSIVCETWLSHYEQKLCIYLYKCCITRAVHIDIVLDLSTPFLTRCLKRFISRRGMPYRMSSDNGSTFKSADRVLQKIMTDNTVLQYSGSRKIEWSFNIEKALWWGGIFENMIGLNIKWLQKIIGHAKFLFDS